MKTLHTTAPDIPNPAYPKGGYPTKGERLGPAWASLWRALERAEDGLDGKELTDKVAKKADLAPTTLVNLLGRAAKAGLLTKEFRPVKTTRGLRNRAFYRINRNA